MPESDDGLGRHMRFFSAELNSKILQPSRFAR